MPDPNLELLGNVRRDTSAAVQERAAAERKVAEQTAAIADLTAQTAAAESRGDLAAAVALRERATAATIQRRNEAANIKAVNDKLREIVDRLRDQVDPCDADPSLPLVLLPVRIETRYTQDQRTLRVRIYPDDIHIDQLDRGLTDDEAAAGRAYWTAAASGAAAAEQAWSDLVAAAGVNRAQWAALAQTPTNLAEWKAGAAPAFPVAPPRARRPAMARLLPDRFVVVADQGNQRSTATGRTIAAEVVSGLLAGDGSEWVDVAGVKTPAGAEWVVDYDQALAAGLAVNLPLAVAGAAVDRLFVVGVRTSLDPAHTPGELADLLTAHRCTDGLAFIPQGAPTNNTDTDRSAWQDQPPQTPPTHLLGAGPVAGGNADVLAAALGLDPQALAGLPHADDREQPLARAMNAALWGVSWGAFLDRITQADAAGAKVVIPDATIETTRNFFRDSVRGRGPLPAVRIGKQPYGLLPVSSLAADRWKADARDVVQASVLPLLRQIRGWWDASADASPNVMAGGAIDQALLDILGTSPVSEALRVRTVVTDDARKSVIDTGVMQLAANELGIDIEAVVLASVGIDRARIHAIGSLESKSRPLAFPLVHESDAGYATALLAGNPPAAQSVLQALLALAWDAAQNDVKAAAPKTQVRGMLDAATKLTSARKDRLVGITGRADTAGSVELLTEADALAAEVGESGRSTLKTYSPVAAYAQSFADLTANSTVDSARQLLATAGMMMWLRATARQAEVRESIQLLATSSLDERRILFAELLDLASHRLDAWLTGIVERRRAALRQAKPAGLTIGAFGWVENIAVGGGAAPQGGYIHAPSLDHAATAGILRSAFLTHNPDANGSGAFAIDLSSARVRTALHLLDGMRQGQHLSALLGYRIERALHAVRLDRLVLTLRGLAPLVGGKLTDRGEAVPAPSAESIAANNVVDGVRLIELYKQDSASRNALRQALNDPPKDNPYLAPGAWPALTAAEWASVEKVILDAADACDAAADLLLAESVHHLARGNTARASAALSAAGGGDVPPPDPDVIRTPTPGVAFTHRVLVVAGGAASTWNAGRPRSTAEPALESWAAVRLGPPGQVVVGAAADGQRITLDAAGLSALDVLYESADRRRLEQRVRAAVPALAIGAPLADRRDPAWPVGLRAFGEIAELAAALHAVLVTARPATPGDFCRPGETATRTISAESLTDVRSRAAHAHGGLSSAIATLATAVSAGIAADPDQIGHAIEAVAAYGVVVPMAEGENLLALAEVALAEGARRLDRAQAALDAAPFDTDAASAVSQALFGDGFWILPAIDPAPGGDLFAASFDPARARPPRAELRRFVRDIASVREPIARMSLALLLGDALGRPGNLTAVQLAATPMAWVGGKLDMTLPTPREPITSVLLDASAEYAGDGPTFALAVDGWTDVVPSRAKFGQGDAAPVGDQRATGVAVNAASASARPPQAVLIAISPDGQRWTADRVVEVLIDTLRLSKSRTVTLERVLAAGRVLPALYQKSWSLQGEKVLDLRFAAIKADLTATLAYVKETP